MHILKYIENQIKKYNGFIKRGRTQDTYSDGYLDCLLDMLKIIKQ